MYDKVLIYTRNVCVIDTVENKVTVTKIQAEYQEDQRNLSGRSGA
jgi:hypothetical protein